MSILDTLLAYVSPRLALSRERARLTLSMTKVARLRFDGARDKNNRQWETTSAGANAELSAGLIYLRNRSRDLIRNNPHAFKACREFQIKSVKTGILAKAKTGKKNLDKRTDVLWAKFSKKCSADGLSGFAAVQSQIARAWWESGEVFVRYRYRRPEDKLPVPLQYQVLESDYLDSTRSGQAANGSYIVNGVQFNQLGQREGYYLFSQHPGETLVSFNRVAFSQFVPASEIVHFYWPDRPGQVRGMPMNAAVISTMFDTGSYREAELVRKRVEACFSVFVTQQESIENGPQLAEFGMTEDGIRLDKIQPGLVEYLKPGESVEFGQPSSGGNFESFKRSLDHDIAAGQMIPYELMTGDLSQVNYSSYRGSLLSYRDFIEWATWMVLIPGFDAMRDEFARVAFIAQLLPEAETITEWGPPKFDLLDRNEEAKATTIEVRTGVKTWRQAVSEQGLDPDEQLAEIAATNEQLDQLKIILDTDPRRMSAAGQTQQNGGTTGDAQPTKT